MSIAADPGSSLKIERQEPTVNALVDYASEGGGNISLKISGVKKRVLTNRTKKEVELDEIEVQGNPDAVALALRQLLSW